MSKFKSLVNAIWDKEFIRFLFSGGVNTLAGYVVMLLFGNLIIKNDAQVLGITIPRDIMAIFFEFLICFPLAYTLQAKVTFRQKWEIKRMFLYITTVIPNMLFQLLFSFILPRGIMNELLRTAIIIVAPLPIMFIIIKFIVTPFKRRNNCDNDL